MAATASTAGALFAASADAMPAGVVSLLNGNGAPRSDLGMVGDFYIDDPRHMIYGPKRPHGWGPAVSLIGPAGPAGEAGQPGPRGAAGAGGYSLLHGSGPPGANIGVDGDVYIDTATAQLYSAKDGGAWGPPVSVTGSASVPSSVISGVPDGSAGSTPFLVDPTLSDGSHGNFNLGSEMPSLVPGQTDPTTGLSTASHLTAFGGTLGSDGGIIGNLYTNTTGTCNTAIGWGACIQNTTGSANTALGEGALFLNNTGSWNVAVGINALRGVGISGPGASCGNSNTAVGSETLSQGNTASYNTAVGFGALQYNISGGPSVGVGYYALNANTSGGENTAAGFYALAHNTTASANTALGYNALGANTTGAYQTAVGANALAAAMTPANPNTAVGANALTALKTGYYQTALGYGALSSSTSDTDNTAVGHNALATTNGGTDNTAVGHEALTGNTTGDANTAVGSTALKVGTTGTASTAIGYGALTAQSTGGYNTAAGYAALGGVTTGRKNVAAGYLAGQSIVTGSNNTIIGYRAGDTDGATATTDNSSMTLIGELSQASTGDVIVLGKAIDTRPNLCFGAVGESSLFNTGVGVFYIANAATNPTSSAVNGGVVLYASGGHLYGIGTTGTAVEIF